MSQETEFITIDQFIHCLRTAEADMRAASAHPPGTVLRFVDVDVVNQVRLYEVRQDATQRDLTESPDLAVAAAEERKQAAAASRVVDQIHHRRRREKVSAEALYQALDKSSRPDIARKLLTRDVVNDVVGDDGRVVGARKLTGTIQCSSERTHTIQIKVAGLPAADSALVMIAGVDAPDSLMTRWLSRPCLLRMSDDESILTMCLALMSGFTLEVVVSAAVQFRADAKCTDELLLNLMRIVNAADAARLAQRQLRSATQGLFDDQVRGDRLGQPGQS